jgi:hypothetical protein
MAWPKGKSKYPQSGRRKGSRNKRSAAVEAWARSVVEDPAVQQRLAEGARQGTLPPQVLTMLFAYAYGKPVERHALEGDDGQPPELVIRWEQPLNKALARAYPARHSTPEEAP